MPVLAQANFSIGEFLLWMVYIWLFVIFFWLLITIFSDIFRRHDIHGGVKTLWIIFVIVLPYLGIFVYLIARGKGMAERNIKAMQAQQAAQAEYIKSVTGSSSSSAAEEIARLADLKDKGVLSEEEFASAKAKALG